MTILPRWYSLLSWVPWQKRQQPHPLLCGRTGVIDVLPDHPHEGEVLDTSQIDLGATFDAGGYTGRPEYPDAPSGPRPRCCSRLRGSSGGRCPGARSTRRPGVPCWRR